jgi:arginine/lysine/ornithine decarboxylase
MTAPRFWPGHRPRTAMRAARTLVEQLRLPEYRERYQQFAREVGAIDAGDVRRAFYLAYNDAYCEYLTPEEAEQRVENGEQVVSTTYVTPYPPGYPVLVPGQVFSAEILAFMRSLDTPEVHGYRPDLGYRVYLDKALEIAATARPDPPPDGPAA